MHTLAPSLRATPGAFLRLTFLLLLGFTTAFAAPVKFEIPAQPAPAALMAFSKQARVEVVFSSDDLKAVQANEVIGQFEPDDALGRLLKDTGFTAQRNSGGKYIVKAAPPVVTTGSIRGSLTGEGGRGIPNVLVTIKETSESTETDKFGQYIFQKVAAGMWVLVATAPGYQPLHITDVSVKAGRELLLGKQDMRKAVEGVLKLEPFLVKADAVEQLEKFEVTGTKQKPFESANVDIPRTANDAQPYYIFDAKTIDQSGATNVEDFLKQRLTMNATAQLNVQISNSTQGVLGNTSSIDLRGLGPDKTLILVNGRRMPGVTFGNGTANLRQLQPNLNGIPLSAIDRIEVLPSSASGIYGGSAIGGVVNVVLRKDYSGGEVRTTYDNTWDTDSPRRTLSASYGLSLEGGKTHLLLSASWSDSEPLLLQDRRKIYDRNFSLLVQNDPNRTFLASSAFIGSLPNIVAASTSTTALVLKNGAVVPSRRTYVPAGTSSTTPTSVLYAGLIANAGSWNLELPPTNQSPTGLLTQFGATPKVAAFQASIRRQMLPAVEMFVDLSYNASRTKLTYNPLDTGFIVTASSPFSPFTTNVAVSAPYAFDAPIVTKLVTRAMTLGVVAKLPWGWTGELDYTKSDNHSNIQTSTTDTGQQTADITNGLLNPFVDLLLYPPDLKKYVFPTNTVGASTLDDFALRGSGPLSTLPWGVPNLTIGLERRISKTPGNTTEFRYPEGSISSANGSRRTYFGRSQLTDSGYGEATIPLIKTDWLPLVHALDLQLSGRSERYTVDTGTSASSTRFTTGEITYSGPTLNGQPYFSKAHYTSMNGTVGLKYQPAPEVTLRASMATAFLPPTPDQLVKNPLPNTSLSTVVDPLTGGSIAIQTISGGNPDLTPQNSKSFNAGVIWQPRWRLLDGLRLNAEYYRIEQNNFIGSLTAQTILNFESTYPARVTRSAAGTITLVDTSLVNLYKRTTDGWDLSAEYSFKTAVGTFNIRAAESIILHLKNQYSLTLPEYESVNFPSEGGAAKYKSNGALTWQWRSWTAGWTTVYFSSYRQNGAVGGPSATQRAMTGTTPAGRLPLTAVTSRQGGDTVQSQMYHDLFLGYDFGKQNSSPGVKWRLSKEELVDGLGIQIGIKNIFAQEPPFDAFYNTNYYSSPYGDMRLRSYWINVKKSF